MIPNRLMPDTDESAPSRVREQRIDERSRSVQQGQAFWMQIVAQLLTTEDHVALCIDLADT